MKFEKKDIWINDLDLTKKTFIPIMTSLISRSVKFCTSFKNPHFCTRKHFFFVGEKVDFQ